VFECVPNVSEGQDDRCISSLADAAGDVLLDVHADADHHRSVFTLASSDAAVLDAAVRAFAARVAELVGLEHHAGAHPRFGVLDVVPFVALDGTDAAREVALAMAHEFGAWWAESFAVPVFFYDEAARDECSLPDVRREAFRARTPDVGPPAPHPSLGATAVGARPPLIAVNCALVTADVAVAQRIARCVRERDGGLPGVRALGLWLPTVGRAQVSMNLVDLPRTGLERACVEVRALARAAGTEVADVELVGLVPAAELERCSAEFLRWSGIDSSVSIEARLRR
jgi:glutamate formiminotransferase